MSELISKIRHNFLSTMMPGFYLLILLCILIYAIGAAFNGALIDTNTFQELWGDINTGWVVPTMALVISFLFGSAIGAIRVNDADTFHRKQNKSVDNFKNNWRYWENFDAFPFPTILYETEKQIKKQLCTTRGTPTDVLPTRSIFNETLSKLGYSREKATDTLTNFLLTSTPDLTVEKGELGTLAKKSKAYFKSNYPNIKNPQELKKLITQQRKNELCDLHSLFNFWKLTLCQRCPDTYVLCKDLESRVRLFSGMSWVGIIGSLLSAAILISGIFWTSYQGWIMGIGLFCFTLSVGLHYVFKRNIRRVRTQESTLTFIAYMVHCHTCEAKSEPAAIKTGEKSCQEHPVLTQQNRAAV